METARLRKGDCENAILSFYSQISSSMKNAEIVWGWVINKRTKVGYAHVWYQLTDKRGQKYVIESFSGDWNGIIPMEIIQNTETRKPIFIISHSMLNTLSRLFPQVEEWQMSQTLIDLFTNTNIIARVSGNQSFGMNMNIQRYLSNYEYIEYPENTQGRHWQYTQYANYSQKTNTAPRVNKEISNILEKLHEVFSRYGKQIKQVSKVF